MGWAATETCLPNRPSCSLSACHSIVRGPLTSDDAAYGTPKASVHLVRRRSSGLSPSSPLNPLASLVRAR